MVTPRPAHPPPAHPPPARPHPPVLADGAAADAALGAAEAAVDDLAASLLALESHRGTTLLRSWPLAGASVRRWGRASSALAGLHADVERHRALLARAREARGTRVRPSTGDLARVAALLYSESIELGAGGPVPRMRPAVLLARMRDACAAVGETVERGAAVWDAVDARLDPLDAALADAAHAGGQDAGGEPDLARWRDELVALRREALADPLDRDPARPLDEERVAAAAAGIAAVAAERAARAEASAGLDDRVAALGPALDALTAAEDAAVEVAAVVARTVDTRGAALPVPRPRAPELRRRHEELAAGLADGDRAAAVAQCPALERAVAGARDRARADHEVLAGLVERRGELRGRLVALSAKAAARGGDGDRGRALDALRRDAEDRLWSAPCDLVAATVALRRYQRALDDPEGPKDPADPAEEAT